jgi:hypothetical protein
VLRGVILGRKGSIKVNDFLILGDITLICGKNDRILMGTKGSEGRDGIFYHGNILRFKNAFEDSKGCSGI